MKKNILLNKVGNRVIPFNMDARAFVKMLVDRNSTDAEKARVP